MIWRSLQMPKGVELDEGTATETYGQFVIEPLERGFGVTLGNALRRVLLSSLQGAAVTTLRIEGIMHEFDSIPGVVEDVTEIVLNFKQLRLKLHADKSKRVILEVDKKKEVRAGDIQNDADIEILNPELLLFTLTEDNKVHMEIDIGCGRGYVTSEQNKRPDQALGTIPIDSIFTPVTKVNYQVGNTRVGRKTDYDKLILEIVTDASLSPQNALSFAAKILKDHLQMFIAFEKEPEMAPEEEIDEETIRIRNLLKMKVDELELSVRSSNCLKAAEIKSLEDLVRKTEADMLKYRNFGRKSLSELQEILVKLSLSFAMDVQKYQDDYSDEM
ncbi:DNA-directed RNA polymerase subunit alpha [bacterium]|nr:DNA-directed RNA polymerase subunit alpha [bacterium]